MARVNSTELQRALEEQFGFSSFRPGQQDVMAEVMAGRDCVAVLPTGGGKSLCFQLPAVLRAGLTLVVSPLIALMKDQVDSLERTGIEATFINSSLDPGRLHERMDALAQGRYRLVYVAPERFRNPRFCDLLPRVRVSLLVVDEAHCISQWGHDFRPDYLRLREARQMLGKPRVLALTATATPEVRDDIAAQLALDRPAVIVRGFDRPNLTLAVRRVASHQDKLLRTREILAEHPTGIVYCATRGNVEKVARLLGAAGIRCAGYHGGLPDPERKRTQDRFMAGELAVVAATNAFGMGIDRADLRTIIHWDVPGSIEAYYQEAGRAGRDGAPALCELLFSQADVRTQKFFIEGANPSPALVRRTAEVVCDLCRQGPAPADPAGIAACIGERINRMAVATALGLLERAGMIERRSDPQGARTLVRLLDAETDLRSVIEPLPAKARRDHARLHRLLRYVNHRGCRHAAILHHFGEPARAGTESCDRCDNCTRNRAAGKAARSFEPGAVPVEIEHALGAARSLSGRLGKVRIAQLLAGSKSREVLRMRLDRNPAYGKLAHRSQDWARALLDALLEAGCLELEGTEFPTLRITPHGRAVLRGTGAVSIGMPELDPASKASRGKENRGAGERPSGGPGEANTGDVLAEDDAGLREALRSMRTRLARERKVPPYRILHNATLDAIARLQPRDPAALLAVPGIGPAKLADLGDDILETIGRQADAAVVTQRG